MYISCYDSPRMQLLFKRYADSILWRNVLARCDLELRASTCQAEGADGDRRAVSPSAHDETGTRAQDLSVSAAREGDHAPEPGLGDGHHVHPDGARLRLSRRGAGLVQSPRSVVARINHDGSSILRRDAAGCLGEAWQAGNLQYRPGFAVHGVGL